MQGKSRYNGGPVTVKGITYPSLLAACRAHGIEKGKGTSRIYYRCTKGMTPEEAIMHDPEEPINVRERLAERRLNESYSFVMANM